jgi:hypothetical protein
MIPAERSEGTAAEGRRGFHEGGARPMMVTATSARKSTERANRGNTSLSSLPFSLLPVKWREKSV